MFADVNIIFQTRGFLFQLQSTETGKLVVWNIHRIFRVTLFLQIFPPWLLLIPSRYGGNFLHEDLMECPAVWVRVRLFTTLHRSPIWKMCLCTHTTLDTHDIPISVWIWADGNCQRRSSEMGSDLRHALQIFSVEDGGSSHV